MRASADSASPTRTERQWSAAPQVRKMSRKPASVPPPSGSLAMLALLLLLLVGWPPDSAAPATSEPARAGSRSRALELADQRHRRQVELELAVGRLQALERLDGQLRAFVAAAERRARRQQVCVLRLDFSRRHQPACLGTAEYRRQVPPYMLNLYGQLMGAASSLADAVRLMPYKSLVMRSFRQPAPTGDRRGLTGADLVVELAALPAPADPPPPDTYELAADTPPDEWGAPASCQPDARLQAASGRRELCFWFHLSDQMRARLNGSRGPPDAGGLARERLVEAELHLFKLPPESAANWTRSLRSQLLEVSLYQVLPQRRPGGEREFPLRLLDIRRIDLGASGWETFYVKRALDDWLRDARLNLGLVIKAKSMFEEPIRLGLIRFADLREPAPDQTGEPADFGLSHQPVLVLYSADAAHSADRGGANK